MISHDLGLVANVCRRVAVMYAGRIVEERNSADIFRSAAASLYARPGRLAAAARRPRRASAGRRLQEISGVVPAIANFPAGCRFNPRCAQRLGHLPDHRARRRRCSMPAGSSGAITCLTPQASRLTTSSSASRISRCTFPSAAACSAAAARLLRAVDGVDLQLQARRVPRPRRRIRLRQIDGRTVDPRPAGADARPHRARRRGRDRPAIRSTARRWPASCRWCFRTLTPRSIRARPCAARWKTRCACMA